MVVSIFFTIICVVLGLWLLEIGVIALSGSMFILALKNPEVSVDKHIEILGDRYLLYVYVLHMLFIVYSIL